MHFQINVNMANKHSDNDENIVDLGSSYSKFENFFKTYNKALTFGLVAIVVLAGGFVYYMEMIQKPNEEKAKEEIFTAEYYFGLDSFNLALNGKEGEYYGFIQVIDEYGNTKAGNLAYYYAGICYLNTGKFQEAIDHLGKFSSNDIILSSMALGCTGDAYRELGNSEEAVKYYEKAADKNINDYTTPLFLKKAALTFEEDLKNNEKALSLYKRIQKEFANTEAANDIEKYIARIEFSQSN